MFNTIGRRDIGIPSNDLGCIDILEVFHAQGYNKILGRKGFRQVLAFYSAATGHVPMSMRKSTTKSTKSRFSASGINKMVSPFRIEMTVSKLEINFDFLGLPLV
jgi:hypothetical protein